MSRNEKTVGELFRESLEGEYDDDAPWERVRELRRRNTPEVFDLAVEFCLSDVPLERARGLDVLAQLGGGKPESQRVRPGDCVVVAMSALGDADAIVVHSAAWALSHLRTPEAMTALCGLRRHADPGVRWAVAAGIVSDEDRDRMIRTLTELMKDPDEDVRDWATFGLGTQCDADSVEIRDALTARLSDPPTADEAVWGLTRRRDLLGLKILIERLKSAKLLEGDRMAAREVLDLDCASEVDDDALVEGLQTIEAAGPA